MKDFLKKHQKKKKIKDLRKIHDNYAFSNSSLANMNNQSNFNNNIRKK